MTATVATLPPEVADQSNSGPRRVLVLYERGRAGTEALHQAIELGTTGSELTVLTLAPQAQPIRCCGPGPGAINCAVREEAQLELDEARAQLGPLAPSASFKVLVEGRDPPTAHWIAEQDVELVLLPAHHLTVRGGPLARKLRRYVNAEIRVVGP